VVLIVIRFCITSARLSIVPTGEVSPKQASRLPRSKTGQLGMASVGNGPDCGELLFYDNAH
jgi:hypothetical protein